MLALAQVVAPSPDNLPDFLHQLLGAVTSKQWPLAGALALIGAVWGVKKFLGPKVPFLASDAGGTILALLGAAGAALVTVFLGGGAFSWPVLVLAAKLFLGAGGLAQLKHLAALALNPLFAKWGLTFGAAAVQAAAKVEGAKAADATPSVNPSDVVNK